MTEPLVTIAVPSFNQGAFFNDTLTSIFQQKVPLRCLCWTVDPRITPWRLFASGHTDWRGGAVMPMTDRQQRSTKALRRA